MRRLLDEIYITDFYAVPVNQVRSGNSHVYQLPGRTINGGDYFWYNAYLRCATDAEYARNESDIVLPNPFGYRTGFKLGVSESDSMSIVAAKICYLPVFPVSASFDVVAVVYVSYEIVLRSDAFTLLVCCWILLLDFICVSCDGVVKISEAINRLNTHISCRTETTIAALVIDFDLIIHVPSHVLELFRALFICFISLRKCASCAL